ncbi:hypothetical protein V6Z11_A11G350700 [Gossypium hirsutum]
MALWLSTVHAQNMKFCLVTVNVCTIGYCSEHELNPPVFTHLKLKFIPTRNDMTGNHWTLMSRHL